MTDQAWAQATTQDFPAVDGVTASVYEIPTDQPEAGATRPGLGLILKHSDAAPFRVV
jgi:hypothetical protein